MRALSGCLIAAALSLLACSDLPSSEEQVPTRRRPVIVVGIDGAEWSVVEELWGKGQLPHLARLAEEGVAARLGTAYGASPVIWTTIATGVVPEEHGITGFVVSGPGGDVPVSSTVRRAPALWNMLSAANRRVAVVGWWASWPAEEVDGVVISDRALLEVERGVSPPELRERFEAFKREALAAPNEFGGNPAARDRDQVTARAAEALAGEGFDLLLAYFRGVDIASHFTWRYFRPEGFPEIPAEEIERLRDEIPRVYRATDAAIGRILEAAPEANVFVVSDHGFHAAKEEEVRVVFDLDRLLERLGYLARRGGAVDTETSAAYTFGSAPAQNPKRVRLGGGAGPGMAEQLAAEFREIRWDTGKPAFWVRPPRPKERREGVDLVVRVAGEGAGEALVIQGKPWRAPVGEIVRISGTHGPKTEGLFLAHGPDVDPAADLEAAGGITIHDLAPTLLYALGLPVAEDFSGIAKRELFTEAFRQANPLRTIDSWGRLQGKETATSAADQELLEELRSLGYID